MNGVGRPGSLDARLGLLEIGDGVMRDLAAPSVSGRISIARTQRGSVMPDGVTRLSQASCETLPAS